MSAGESLGGCRVVVTRPAEQANELVAPLRERGALVRSRPLVAIAPPAEPTVLRAALAALRGYDWVAFTSANAVRACVALRPAGAGWPRVACVGRATAAAASAAGIPVDLVPEEYSGAGLARALVPLLRPGARVLWPRASAAREDLPELLRRAGAVVDDVECYRTEPDPAAAVSLAAELAGDPADVLIFTSPSAVRTFAAVGGAGGAAVAVIGTVTAAAAEAAGWQTAIRPAEQSGAGLVVALEAWWRERPR